MSTDVDVSHFREVTENYPGWTWNELVQVFVAAGIFVYRGGTPATCDDRVVT